VARSRLVSSQDELLKLSLVLPICQSNRDCGVSRVVEVIAAAHRCCDAR
jgi:hypothetical protein